MALNYITLETLRGSLTVEELADLTDDDADTEDFVDENLLTEIVERAESWVDTYLTKRYDVPLTTVPAIIEDAVIVRTKYKLFNRRHFVDESLAEEYAETKEWLAAVAEGENDLPEDEVSATQLTAENISPDYTNTIFDEQLQGR